MPRTLLLAVLLVCASAGMALQPSTPLGEYGRQSWGLENGLPQNSVQALLQTSDGFLWIGTEDGLARFDGYTFTIFDRSSVPALPGNDIRCLLQDKHGALWIGTSAGLARWKNGKMTAYTQQNGLPGTLIRALAMTPNGILWVWTDQGPVQQNDGRFFPPRPNQKPPAMPGIEPGNAGAAFTLPMGGNARTVANGNSLHLTVPVHGRQQQVSLIPGKNLPGNRIQAVLADPQGALWIGTNAGLVRWDQGNIEHFPLTDPLAAASILALLEDREGNLWVGTENNGLHILRNLRFTTYTVRDGLSSDATTAVVADRDNHIWVGTQQNGLNQLHITRNPSLTVQSWSVHRGLASDIVLSLAPAPNDGIWVGTPDGLNHILKDHVTTFTSADGLPDDFIRSLLVDPDGSLWIGTRRGLVHWKNPGKTGAATPAQMTIYTRNDGLGSDLVGAMARDAHGDLWIATLAGLSRLRGGKIENFTTANGLSSNVVTALLPRADGTVVVGTQDQGWDLWNGSRFIPADRDTLRHASIHAILQDDLSHLWFATDNGIARCSEAGGSIGCRHWIGFGTADGLPSRETSSNSHPSAWKSPDGHLWFATPRGLVTVDPARFVVNRLPPPVVIEQFAVDDVNQPLPTDAVLQIPAGHVHFQFDYAGLSFIAPQKVRYRYILQGFDHAWTEAGTRRTAYYTNIPPGRYTFRVQAANNDGVWNTAGAALQFQLQPRFYQTFWFYLLLAVALAAAIALLVRGRLQIAKREFQATLSERNRIAREIHDTLAQGYAGISVQLEVLAELLRLRRVDAAVEQLNQARTTVREGLDEARQSIWALRTQETGEFTLPTALRRLVEKSASETLASEFRLSGAYRPLPAAMEREVLRIAQEAMHNVKKHAAAQNMRVELVYEPDSISLEIRDDGRGGAQATASQSATGHFGLVGMQERAAAIGGTLRILSEPGAGTTVRLHVRTPSEPRKKAGTP
jgi:signal transduction histidine kinase/ligand-binding sensor domain-containing protein